MNLSRDETRTVYNEGYLFWPSCFSTAEAAVLRRAADEVCAMDREEVWRESSGVARTAFAAHAYHEAFRRLGRHPRLIGPVMQLVDGPVYMHQYKVNAKAAFDGEIWQWHQDYGTWARDDGMPEPRAMNIAVFLDEVTAANGPLILLSGSHKHGVFEAGHDLETTSYPLWTLDRATVTRLAEEVGSVRRPGRRQRSRFASTLVHAAPEHQPVNRCIRLSLHLPRGQPHPPFSASRVGRPSRFPPHRRLAATASPNSAPEAAPLSRRVYQTNSSSGPLPPGPVRIALHRGRQVRLDVRARPHHRRLEVSVIADLDARRARAACRTVGWSEPVFARTRFTDDAREACVPAMSYVVVGSHRDPAAGIAHARAALRRGNTS